MPMHPFRALLITALCCSPLLAADDEAVAALEGGTPLPAGEHHFTFPSIAKQSISFISEADERIAGVVAFSGEAALGHATFDVNGGSGSASLSLAVADMRTGDATRDEHMWSSGWLDAENHPTITFSDVSLRQRSPTVWEVTGTWTIKGVSREKTSLANIRFIPTFPRFGENIVRVRTSFDIPIKEFGITNAAVGTPAVAEVWQIEVTLLGKLGAKEE
ncbi:MAG: YceI family protein [Planctomycetota bacterium]|nr:MAG: YceI family protein [Planctomycetota bacterium]